MSPADDEVDGRFTKSRKNQGVQKTGREILLRDPRFQEADLPTRRAIIKLIGGGGPGGYGPQTFDLLMIPKGIPTITDENVAEHLPQLRLVEMKATRKAIKSAALNSFFFGVTESERRLAEVLGSRYLFAFVVLNSANDFGRPFVRLLTLEELKERTKPWRTQFQVNFRSDLSSEGLVADGEAIIVLGQLPPE